MVNGLPDGWLSRGALIFGEGVRENGVISRGANVRIPDLRTCGTSTIWDLYAGWLAVADSLGDNEALQLQWGVSSDGFDFIESYEDMSERISGSRWPAHVRRCTSEQMTVMMERGLLRREKLSIYLGRKMSGVRRVKDPGALFSYVEKEAENLSARLAGWGSGFPGGTIEVMDDSLHAAAWEDHFHPGRVLDANGRARHFSPLLSLQEQCLHSAFTHVGDRGESFFRHDGYFQAMIVLRRWPTTPTMGIMTKLTSALAGNYRITMNVYPVMISRAIKEAEQEAERLEQDSRLGKTKALRVKAGQREARAMSLSTGKYKAFKVLPVVRVWASSIDELRAQLGLLKNTLASMSGLQHFQVDHGEQFRQLYAETLPGYLEGNYRHYDIFAQSDFLPTVLPISASFQGVGPSAQALFVGDQNNPVGLNAFSDNGTPLQTTMVAMRGAGKSTWLVNLVSQIASLCGFGVFVEEGQGFTVLTKLLGGQSWVVSPNGKETLNYLDTFGAPLTAVHIGGAKSLALVMSGGSVSDERAVLRQSLIGEYLNQLYVDTWSSVGRRSPERMEKARRMAWVMEKREDLFAPDSQTLEERFAEWKTLEAERPEVVDQALREIGGPELLAWVKTPAGAKAVRDMGIGLMNRDEFPTHTGLVDMMRSGRRSDHDVDEIRYLVATLEEWGRSGPNGVLFDGISNVTLDRPWLHFDFGKIPEGNERLKEVTAFTICNFARQKFVTLPRGMKKMFVLDDPRRYIRSPIMSRNVGEAFSLLRKYSVWVALATQQFDQLKDTPVWKEIVGNTAQYLLMRMESQSDLDELAREIRLPDAAQSMLLKYVLPENQKGSNVKYSDACYFLKTAEGSVAGTIRNYASPEMLYVAASSGAAFDDRKKHLATYSDPFDAVMAAAGEKEKEKSCAA